MLAVVDFTYLIDSMLVHVVFLNQFTDNALVSMKAGHHQTIQVGLFYRDFGKTDRLLQTPCVHSTFAS